MRTKLSKYDIARRSALRTGKRIPVRWRSVPPPFSIGPGWEDIRWAFCYPCYRLTATKYVKSVGMRWTFTKEFGEIFIGLPSHAQGKIVEEMGRDLAQAIRDRRKWKP